MTTIYKLVNWEFWSSRFSRDIDQAVRDMGPDIVAQAIGVDRKTVYGWAKGSWSDTFPHPSMSNFIRACNALDLDPREYFILEDVE